MWSRQELSRRRLHSRNGSTLPTISPISPLPSPSGDWVSPKTLKLCRNCLFDPSEFEAPIRRLLVEFLQSDDGLDVSIDPGQVAAVAACEDAPVLRVPDSPLGGDADLRELGVEVRLPLDERYPRLSLDGGVHVGFPFVPQVADTATRAFHHVDPARLAETMYVVPAARKGTAGADNATMQVDEELDVDAVATMLPRQQILAVPPVERRYE